MKVKRLYSRGNKRRPLANHIDFAKQCSRGEIQGIRKQIQKSASNQKNIVMRKPTTVISKIKKSGVEGIRKRKKT